MLAFWRPRGKENVSSKPFESFQEIIGRSWAWIIRIFEPECQHERVLCRGKWPRNSFICEWNWGFRERWTSKHESVFFQLWLGSRTALALQLYTPFVPLFSPPKARKILKSLLEKFEVKFLNMKKRNELIVNRRLGPVKSISYAWAGLFDQEFFFLQKKIAQTKQLR